MHTTRGPSASSIFSGTVYDPGPYIAAAISGSAAVGGIPTPVPSIQEEPDMHYYRAIDNSKNGRIGAGYLYVQGAEGPLRALTNLEGSYVAAMEASGKVFIASWSGEDIWTLSTLVGIRKYGAMPNLRMANGTPLGGPGKLTEEIIYGAQEALPLVRVK